MPESPLIAAHRRLLAQWRGAMNLVGPGPLDPHYADADVGLALLDPDPPAGRWADLGTGAGFPGIPFAARFPSARVELVDSRQKRCVFLEHVLREAGADGVTVRCARIETLPPGAYDGVVSRALAPPAEVLGHAARLLRPGGRAVLWLGDAEVPLPPGFQLIARHRYASDPPRQVLVLRWVPPG
ncbi:MAG: 16S rRNA (guanine(527)-N(7))-methyltransferase RsmG [Myxococcota bacterium]